VSTTLLVDGHVHFHSCFEVEPFLEAALSNFRAASRQLGEPDAIGCLMLTENSWNHYFRAFSEGLAERETTDWSVRQSAEDCSLVVRKDSHAEIIIIAGRQVVTADRLEVLALATAQEFPDGLPFDEAVESVVASGSIPVVPWGFGKWTARRGRTVRALLSSPDADVLYLGDNGGRPAGAPSPALFRLAGARGVPVLPGSDPLPLPAEVGKPGRYGFVLRGSVDIEAPASSIKSILSPRAQPQRFGRLEALGTFVLRQTQLRLRRHEPAQAHQAIDLEAGRS
jgi:hypothetical protein